MTQHWASHSGSRWEPVGPSGRSDAPHGPRVGVGFLPALDLETGRRRRRGPVLAVLMTLLTFGTASAGVAYADSLDSPADPTVRTSGEPRAAANPDGSRDHGADPYRGTDGGRTFADRRSADGHAAPGAWS